MTDEEWLQALPKVELHLHLEGAIPHTALWALVQKYGGDAEVRTLADLERRFVYRDFDQFLDAWGWKNGFLRAYDDFEMIAEAVARALQQQNIVYAEVFYSPGDFHCHGLETGRLTEAVRCGLTRVAGVEVRLVCDLIRDFGPERGARTLAEVAELTDLGVVGIGIGGTEHAFPPEPYAAVYRQARARGLHTSAHAGEAAGPESVWGALRALEVDRIGHATRAIEDPALVDLLAARQLPLELCPLSNVRTGVVGSLAAHPVRRYFDRGLAISVNTDDPAMFGNSLAGELLALMRAHTFTRAEIVDLMRRAVRASWADEERRARLLQALSP